MPKPVRVGAYSGYKGEQEPRWIELGDEERLEVLGIADRWYDPSASYFKVRASDGAIYLLRCDSKTLEWTLVRRWAQDS